MHVFQPMNLLLGALILPAVSGCMSLPPDVAAELSAPDGARPNNYAPAAASPADAAGTPPEAR